MAPMTFFFQLSRLSRQLILEYANPRDVLSFALISNKCEAFAASIRFDVDEVGTMFGGKHAILIGSRRHRQRFGMVVDRLPSDWGPHEGDLVEVGGVTVGMKYTLQVHNARRHSFFHFMCTDEEAQHTLFRHFLKLVSRVFNPKYYQSIFHVAALQEDILHLLRITEKSRLRYLEIDSDLPPAADVKHLLRNVEEIRAHSARWLTIDCVLNMETTCDLYASGVEITSEQLNYLLDVWKNGGQRQLEMLTLERAAGDFDIFDVLDGLEAERWRPPLAIHEKRLLDENLLGVYLYMRNDDGVLATMFVSGVGFDMRVWRGVVEEDEEDEDSITAL